VERSARPWGRPESFLTWPPARTESEVTVCLSLGQCQSGVRSCAKIGETADPQTSQRSHSGRGSYGPLVPTASPPSNFNGRFNSSSILALNTSPSVSSKMSPMLLPPPKLAPCAPIFAPLPVGLAACAAVLAPLPVGLAACAAVLALIPVGLVACAAVLAPLPVWFPPVGLLLVLVLLTRLAPPPLLPLANSCLTVERRGVCVA
jgi:hypothetical protein